MEKEILEIIERELNQLDRGIVATPKTREDLDSFSNANHGSNDVLLTQMATQFGFKIALEYIQDHIKLRIDG